MVEKTEGQRQLISPTISGTRKAEARRAEVDDRLAFKGGINGQQGQQAVQTQNGSAALAGTVKTSGTRGTIVNITA